MCLSSLWFLFYRYVDLLAMSLTKNDQTSVGVDAFSNLNDLTLYKYFSAVKRLHLE